jgi:hypothetical protein
MKETDYYKSGRMKSHLLEASLLAKEASAKTTANKINNYNLNPNKCTYCRNDLLYKSRNNKFCTNSCAAHYNNSKRDITAYSNDAKEKISRSLTEYHASKFEEKLAVYNASPKFCNYCSEIMSYEKKNRSFCSSECRHQGSILNGRKGGLKSASGPRSKRSKNEIAFHKLCVEHFNTVTHNDPIFNGWDADVLIHDHKIAVLWNGDWHYQEMGCYNHSLKQVQNRDAYKAKLIDQHDWILYIIKDTTDHPTKPSDAFITLLSWIKINCSKLD